MKFKIGLFILLLSSKLYSQTSSNTLSYKEFVYNVISEHPLAKSAQLKERVAKAKLLSAKGSFDPKLTSSIDEKNFEGKEYYNIFTSKISIPTPIGVNVTGGFDKNAGDFLNNSDKTTGSGLWNAGLEVDVLQGLFTNQRRTDVKNARVYQTIAKNQQMQLLNELVYNASKAYADWQQYTSIYAFLQKNIQLSYLYLDNVKSAFKSGEKTAIDTLEANVYLQTDLINLEKYKQLLFEKRLKVENYLWLDNNTIGLKEETVPEKDMTFHQPEEIILLNNLDSIPIIAEKIAKREQLVNYQRLNKEKLKPKLKLKYNQLFGTTDDKIRPLYDVDDYKWSASLSLPILFRKERGKIKQGRFKINDLDYEIANKKQEVQNKIIANKRNQQALATQVDLLEQNIKGYERLLDAETQRFDYGESSLFLINKRQEKLIASKLKLLSSENKLITNYLNYLLLTNNIIPNE